MSRVSDDKMIKLICVSRRKEGNRFLKDYNDSDMNSYLGHAQMLRKNFQIILSFSQN